jgi:hypothetical protein
LIITDASNPDDGVLITADTSGGETPASVIACDGASQFSFTADDQLVVTCGSVTAEVIRGSVDIMFVADDDTHATVSLAEDNSLTFEPTTLTFSAPEDNDSDEIIVLIEGKSHSIIPGATVQLVEIDIKPGSYPNCFNNDGHGVIPVAIFSSDIFNATQVDSFTIELDGQVV